MKEPLSEIVCVRAEKIYDLCQKQDIRFFCFDPPPRLSFPLAPEILCSSRAGKCSWREIEQRPAFNFPPGFFVFTVQVEVPVYFTLHWSNGIVLRSFLRIARFYDEIILYAPKGTFLTGKCNAGKCSHPIPVSQGRVGILIPLSLVFQTQGSLNLLLPSYGYCSPFPWRTPSSCETAYPIQPPKFSPLPAPSKTGLFVCQSIRQL